METKQRILLSLVLFVLLLDGRVRGEEEENIEEVKDDMEDVDAPVTEAWIDRGPPIPPRQPLLTLLPRPGQALVPINTYVNPAYLNPGLLHPQTHQNIPSHLPNLSPSQLANLTPSQLANLTPSLVNTPITTSSQSGYSPSSFTPYLPSRPANNDHDDKGMRTRDWGRRVTLHRRHHHHHRHQNTRDGDEGDGGVGGGATKTKVKWGGQEGVRNHGMASAEEGGEEGDNTKKEEGEGTLKAALDTLWTHRFVTLA